MWGKIFGAAIGATVTLLLMYPLWLVGLATAVGVLVGHYFLDYSFEPPAPKPHVYSPFPPRQIKPPEARPDEILLAQTLCPLFIELARADGTVAQSEIRVVREFFIQTLGFEAPAQEVVRVALKDALASEVRDVTPLAQACRRLLEPPRRLDLVEALYELAQMDSPANKSEIDFMKHVVTELNLSDEQLQKITTKYFGSAQVHYQHLRIVPSASDDEVRSAFRKLALEYHPDRFASKPKPEGEQAAAKFRAIKEAYEALKRIRGL
jgi:DnaJ like chaperone protein